jgi:hypothetical protein
LPFVVFQFEALDEREVFGPKHPGYRAFLRDAIQIWDYSETNLAFLAKHGCRQAHYILLGNCERLECISHAAVKDIDVFCCGSMNERGIQNRPTL